MVSLVQCQLDFSGLTRRQIFTPFESIVNMQVPEVAEPTAIISEKYLIYVHHMDYKAVQDKPQKHMEIHTGLTQVLYTNSTSTSHQGSSGCAF